MGSESFEGAEPHFTFDRNLAPPESTLKVAAEAGLPYTLVRTHEGKLIPIFFGVGPGVEELNARSRDGAVEAPSEPGTTQ